MQNQVDLHPGSIRRFQNNLIILQLCISTKKGAELRLDFQLEINLFFSRLRNLNKILLLYPQNPKKLLNSIELRRRKIKFLRIISQILFSRDKEYLPLKTLWPVLGCLMTQRWYFAGSECLCLQQAHKRMDQKSYVMG